MKKPSVLQKIPLIGVGVAMQVIGSYLVFFSTVILGIPGSLAGLAVGISVFWDAVTDPVMGYVSDITRSKRFGRRHLYLIIGSVGIAATLYLIWGIRSGMDTGMKFLLIFVYIILFKTFTTIYITPYTALGSELSTDYNERTQIQGIKTIFFLLGLALVSVAGMYFFFRPSPQFPIGQMDPQNYRNIGIASASLVLIFTTWSYIATKKYIPILNLKKIEDVKGSKIAYLFVSMKTTFNNLAFRSVALCYMFNNISTALLSSLGLHVFTFTFGFTSQNIAILLGFQFSISILSQPLWAYISKKIDKKPAMLLGLVIGIIGALCFAVLIPFRTSITNQIVYFLPFSLLAGLATGALFTLPLSMVADTIDLDELKSGKREEGVYFGSLTLLYKTSQAITIFIVGILLDIIKFDATLTLQASSTVIALGWILAIGSVLSFLLSGLSLKPYKLTEKQVREIQQTIEKR
jgi:GPH family glycoside/pentoside/hexuronide:cation symporter